MAAHNSTEIPLTAPVWVLPPRAFPQFVEVKFQRYGLFLRNTEQFMAQQDPKMQEEEETSSDST